MIARAFAVAGLVLATGFWAGGVRSTDVIPARDHLSALPLELAEWRGRDASPLADDVIAQLGVDEYVNREYVRPGTNPVAVYVGYYASQRTGDTVHSPQNCLPGGGWRPVERRRVTLVAGGRPVNVNSLVIQKDLDRQLVYYWYQGRGRVVASDYANKAFLVLDAVRIRRSDGGLVRAITAIATTPAAAGIELAAFTAMLVPHLDRYLP